MLNVIVFGDGGLWKIIKMRGSHEGGFSMI